MRPWWPARASPDDLVLTFLTVGGVRLFGHRTLPRGAFAFSREVQSFAILTAGASPSLGPSPADAAARSGAFEAASLRSPGVHPFGLPCWPAQPWRDPTGSHAREPPAVIRPDHHAGGLGSARGTLAERRRVAYGSQHRSATTIRGPMRGPPHVSGRFFCACLHDLASAVGPAPGLLNNQAQDRRPAQAKSAQPGKYAQFYCGRPTQPIAARLWGYAWG